MSHAFFIESECGGGRQAMIHYLSTRDHSYTVTGLLDGWGRALKNRLRIVHYELLPDLKQADGGLYIFTDMDRLLEPELKLAIEFHRQLLAAGPYCKALNHPAKSKLRYELLASLNRAGINDFRAYRMTEDYSGCRFPAFLRNERDHLGPRSRLIQSMDVCQRLAEHIVTHALADPNDVLLVEYSDTSAGSGVFRKYSAMRIGDQIWAKHLLFGDEWTVKTPKAFTPAAILEEADFLANFPHEESIREVFDLAQIEFGRIDYGLRDGKIRVWEINTNPMLWVPTERLHAGRVESQRKLAEKLVASLSQLDDDMRAGGPIEISFPEELKRQALAAASSTKRP